MAHNLGGLVVKQVLIEAKKYVDNKKLLDIYKSSYGVIFFGTPHRGSELTSWGLILSAVVEAFQIDTHKAMLRDLDPESGSSKLEELSLDSDDILRDKSRSHDLQVHNFQEELGMTSISAFGEKVRILVPFY